MNRGISLLTFLQCHGTGTPVGDPIEATAVANVFGSKGVLIGCAKPAVGHGEAVAGLTAVIKAVLCLENDTIPPNIKFEKPNPKSESRDFSRTCNFVKAFLD